MALQFNAPPGWPAAPPNWHPDANWRPDPSWPPAPSGWAFWAETQTLPEPQPSIRPLAAVPDAALSPAGTPSSAGTPSRWWLRLAWIPTLLFGVLTYLIAMRVMVETQNPILFPTLLFIGAITVPASVLMLVYGLGHRVGQDAVLAVITAVAGGIIGVISAGQLESLLLPSGPGASTTATAIGVAVIEETVKMIVPVAIFLLLRRRSPGMGVTLGIAAGAGFAVLETMGYGFTVLMATNGNVAVVDQTLMLRALLAPASHVAWTGIVAAALWRTADPHRQYRWAVLVGAFITAITLHAVWDATDSTWVQFAVATISLAVLVVAIVTDLRPPQQARLDQPTLVMAPPPPGQPPLTPAPQPQHTDPSAAPAPVKLAS
ncbi:MAG: PrsW family intramembrane metalloprotease [Propionicimonas sp.]